VDFWLFNRVIGLGVAQPATRAQVEDIVGSYTDSEQSSFSVALSPIAEPDGELEGWLRESGFEQAGAHVKLWRPADEPAEPARTSLRIEPAPRAFAPEFERVSVESWGASVSLAPWFSAVMGRQGWYHYIAFDGDLPVATAAMRVEGPVAWFGFSATLASYRGRGAHSALVAQRIADARDLGCRVLHTETVADVPPGPAQRNLLRAGFLPIYERANFIAGERR
jgi:GNAT superfamily N-acetyltransferase